MSGLGRLDHFKHRMVKLLVWELTRNFPALPKIELDGPSIGFNNSKSQSRMATARYFKLTLSEQSLTHAISSVLAKHPEVNDPLLTC